MKNLSILLISISFLSLSACTKKQEASPAPTTAARDKFLGNWAATETGTITKAAQYQVSIVTGDASTESVAILNFQNVVTNPVSGYVSGDSLYLPIQTVDGYTVFGAGIISSSAVYGQNSVIIMSYELTSGTTVIASPGYNGNQPVVW